MKRYHTWVILNADGKEAWGGIFAGGQVPVLSVLPKPATLEGIAQAECVFMVAWKDLTDLQQDAILEKLSKCFNASKDAVLKEILRLGLPLREKYTSGSATGRLEHFL